MRYISTDNQDELRSWIERVIFQKMPADATFIGQKKNFNNDENNMEQLLPKNRFAL